MVEQSPPLLPPEEESIEAEPETALETEPESDGPAPASEPDFVCDCGEWMRSACKGLPFYKEHEGRSHCVLHYPSKEKSADFKAALESKVNKKDFDFRGAWFPDEVDFNGFEFSADAYFISATFSADAQFSSATFSADAYFNGSLFHATASFNEASFKDSVRFFGRATNSALADGATLDAKALGNNPSLDFQHVRIEHPDRIAFHTLSLHPHWFVNVDSRPFVFTDVWWNWGRNNISQEIEALEARAVASPNRLLTITCRQLAENAEGNNRYEEASRFRYWAMDLARRTKWKGWALWKTDWLHMLYWAVSGYGERRFRALGGLAAVWIVFVLLYTQVGFVQQSPKAPNEGVSSEPAAAITIEDKIGQPLEFSRALTYSLAVMSLQKPEPKPLTGTAQTLVLLETILGPVQAALLALAIRRKFMR